jgi:UDP-N-acetylglucosamine:LPS N-acetylglucosamine transferase
MLSNMDKLGRLGDLRLRRIFRSCYRGLQDNSQFMKDVYRFTEETIFQFGGMRDKLARLYGQPDLVLSIQPEVNAVAELLKSWYGTHFHTIIIDLAIHGLWVENNIDRYYVPNEPLKRELMRYGVSANRVTVSGMPLRDGFAMVTHHGIKEVRKKLGLKPELNTVLLIGGLLGKMLDFEGAIESICERNMPVQIVAVFGENETLLNRVRLLKNRIHCSMQLYGTVTNMHELMWASDVVISKPGSVTMAEVLSLGKPLITVSPLAGSAQELRFAEFLQENGAGIWVKSADESGVVLENIIGTRGEYVRISRNARMLGRYGLTANRTIFENIKASLEAKEE